MAEPDKQPTLNASTLEQLADALASDAHPARQWRQALSLADAIAPPFRPSEAQLSTLLRASATPAHLSLLLRLFASHARSLPANAEPTSHPYTLLCDFVDDSAHDLREWVNALYVFADWLHSQKRGEQPLTMLLPYLACSAQGQASSPLPLPLPHILADMLELYGYDGEAAIETEP